MDPLAIKIIFEDNHLLVVEKPVNLPVQGDESGDPDLLSLLKENIKFRAQKPGNVYLGLVHRLDRPTGGVMVFAKTSKAAARLAEQVREREMEKTYLAVLLGLPGLERGNFRDFLVKDEEKNRSRTANAGEPGAREATLSYEVVGVRGNLSLVRIELETGRPHQIRVQFGSRGLPLYGDQKYAVGRSKPGEQLALWAWKLKFLHPVRREIVEFESKPPREYPWSEFVLIG